MIIETRWDGKPISRPGIYVDVPMEFYHSQRICVGTSVSSSGLRRILEDNGGSPAHFYAEWDGNPDAVEPEEKQHLNFGRAVHHLMLGERSFSSQFIIRPNEVPDEDGVLRPWSGKGSSTKGSQAWTAAARETGRTILTMEQVQHIKGMSKALGLDRMVRAGILSGRIERTIIWRDEKTGLWIKVRPDAIPTDSGDFADLKTTISVQAADIRRAISNYAYHQQMALIREAARRVMKIEPASFSLVFIEKKLPYCVRVAVLRHEDLDLGMKQNRRAIDLVHTCIKEKRWPGPGAGEEASTFGLDDWYRKRAVKKAEEGAA